MSGRGVLGLGPLRGLPLRGRQTEDDVSLKTWTRRGIPAALLLSPLASPAGSPGPSRGVDSAFFISRSTSR